MLGIFLAEGVGFEPTLRFPVNTLSKRALPPTRPPLHCAAATAHANFTSRRAPKARWCAFSHSATPPLRRRDNAHIRRRRGARTIVRATGLTRHCGKVRFGTDPAALCPCK